MFLELPLQEVMIRGLPRETVWKIRISFTSGSQESVKRGEKRPYCHFAPPKTRDLDPSSYFTNSFRREILGNQASDNPNSRKLGKGSSRLFKGIETRPEAPPLWHPVAPAQGKALARSRRLLPLQPPSPKGGPHKHSLSQPSSWGALL